VVVVVAVAAAGGEWWWWWYSHQSIFMAPSTDTVCSFALHYDFLNKQ
jgi:hypothetical protein